MWGILNNLGDHHRRDGERNDDEDNEDVQANGWDDDDVDPDYDDDDENENVTTSEEEEEPSMVGDGGDGHEQQQQQQHQQQPQQQHQQHFFERPPAVGNMLMGRLTRFLEQVAHPDDDDDDSNDENVEEEEDSNGMQVADGWGDDDGIDDVDVNDDAVVVTSDVNHHHPNNHNNSNILSESLGNALGWNNNESSATNDTAVMMMMDNNNNNIDITVDNANNDNAWKDNIDDNDEAIDFVLSEGEEGDGATLSSANTSITGDAFVSQQVSEACQPLDDVLNEINAMEQQQRQQRLPRSSFDTLDSSTDGDGGVVDFGETAADIVDVNVAITPTRVAFYHRAASITSTDGDAGVGGRAGTAVSEDEQSRTGDQHHYDQAVRDIQQEIQNLDDSQQQQQQQINMAQHQLGADDDDDVDKTQQGILQVVGNDNEHDHHHHHHLYLQTTGSSMEEEEQYSEALYLTPQNTNASSTDGFLFHDAQQQQQQQGGPVLIGTGAANVDDDDDDDDYNDGGGGGGWDADDDVNLDFSAGADDNVPISEHVTTTTTQPPVAAATIDTSNNGWADDDDDLDISAGAVAEEVNEHVVVVAATVVNIQQDTPVEPPAAATTTIQDDADGWAGDDGDIDLDLSAEAETDNAMEEKAAAPAETSAIKQHGWDDVDVDLDVSGAVETEGDDNVQVMEDNPAPPSPENLARKQDGWDDDDVDLDLSGSAEADTGDGVAVETSTTVSENAGQESSNDKANEEGTGRRVNRNQSAGSDDTPVVDHTPGAVMQRVEEDPSLVPQVALEDRTRDTGPEQTDECVYDDENEDAYGPIVDHTPKSSTKPLIHLSRQDSLAVQAMPQDIDDSDDDDVDDDEQNEQDIEDVVNVPNGWTGDVLPGEDSLLFLNGGAPPEPSMVDHTPASDDSTLTPKQRAGDSSVSVLPSVGDTIDMEPDDVKDMDDAHDFGPVVDHTPQNQRVTVAPMSGNQSMVVTAPALEDDIREDEAMDESVDGGDGSTLKTADVAAGVDDGWDVDEPDIDGVDEVTSPLSSPRMSETRSRFRKKQVHVVDHTPDSEAQDGPENADPSVIVLATVDDLTRDTGTGNDDEEVYDDENELDYVPVVDHTPSVNALTQSATVASSRLSVNSLAVHASALDEDFQEHDAMEETCFGESTIADGTLDGATLDGAATLDEAPDGWEQDDVVLDSITKTPREETMVDQTPSEMGASALAKNADPSVAVLASIDENDSVEEDHGYGPVVDQTPTTPAPGQNRSDSVIVQAADQETVDETLVDGGSTEAEGNDGDTIDEELPSALRSLEDKLVDHIPARPESRFGDASTLVAADPSEVMSEVDDDMAQEETHFGPVVDVTPLMTRPAALPSAPSVGAGSTAVIASPSVAVDDLDDADETEGNADDTEGNVDDGWGEEKAPNPQSGNDEPVTPVVNEQVVDFIPPQDAAPVENRGETSTRAPDVESELTVRGADSLLQAEEPKEDDFGPVVDLTPIPRIAVSQSGVSNTSTATQVTASEISRLEKDDKSGSDELDRGKSDAVVDHVPQMHESLVVDSLATAVRSQMSEEDEEEENDSKFGPVVDHLPTPRNSSAPSRGGSTVDALATVSEVHSDDEGGNGWEDDLDLDASEAASEITDKISQPQSASRGFFRRMGSGDHDRGMSVRFDASVRDGRPIYEVPYRSPGGGSDRPLSDTDLSQSSTQNDLLDYRQPTEPLILTSSFADADTPPSTPHQRPSNSKLSGRIVLPADEKLLHPLDLQGQSMDSEQMGHNMSKKNGSMFGTLITSEGESVQVDFGKLLEEEIAKRKLVEEEIKALRSAAESRKLECELVASKESELEEELSQMRQSNDYFLERIESVQTESSTLREENSRLTDSLASTRRLVDTLEESKTTWHTKQSAWEAEIETLKRALSDATTRLSTEECASNQVVALHRELSLKNGECHQLNVRVSELQQSLQTAEDSGSRKSREVENLSKKLEEEATRLRDLRVVHAQLEERAHSNEEAKKEVANKLEAVEVELQHTLNDKEDLFNKLTAAQEHACANEEAKKEAQDTMSAAKMELQRVHAEKENLSKRLTDLHVQHEADLKKQYELLDKKANDIKSLEDRLKAAEDEKTEIATSLSHEQALAEEAEKLASELLSVAKERDLLQEALAESKDAVDSLQKHIDEHGMEHEVLESKRAQEITSLTAEVKRLQEVIKAKDVQTTELSTQLNCVEQEKIALGVYAEELESECSSLKASLEETKLLVTDEESKAETARTELESLRADFDEIRQKWQTAESERTYLSTRIDELDSELKNARESCELQSSKISELEVELHTTRDQVSSLAADNAALFSENQRLETTYRELESSSNIALAEANSYTETLSKRHDEDLQALNIECERLRQEVDTHDSGTATELANVRLQLDDITKERNSLSFEKEDMLVQFGLLNGQLDAAVAQLKDVENETNTLQLLTKALVENKNSRLHPDDIPDLSLENLKIVEAINGLRESNAELENQVERLSAEKEAAEASLDELQSVVEELQVQCETIENTAIEKDRRIEELREQLVSSTADNERNWSELHSCIEQLRRESSEKDHLLEAKETEISAFRARLQYGDNAAHELQELRHLMCEKDEELCTGANKMKELEERCSFAESELFSMKQQLATTKAALDAGVSNQQVSSVVARYERRNNDLEVEIKEKTSRISQLEHTVDKLERTSAQLAVEQGKSQDEEIQSLRDKVESLQNALHESHDRISSKEEIVSRLTAELRQARDKEMQTASAVLRNGGDKSEDVNSLRQNVVSLAIALERSENRRAEALDTLLTEREANANRLRQLGESLKRYYETVSS